MNLVEIDDGFKPGKTDKPTLLAVNQAKQCRDFVCVFDDLLDDLWCDRAYEYSARVHGGRPWGVYVSTSDLLDIEGIRCEDIWEEAELAAEKEIDVGQRPQSPDGGDISSQRSQGEHDLYQRAIGIYTARKLLYERGGSMLGTDLKSEGNPRIAGTVVWSLCSSVSSQVEYHIDYAELYRYETNIIHPPLYAGTVQVSPLGTHSITQANKTMEGGSFLVNTAGLEHYKRFGYKGKLVRPESGTGGKESEDEPAMVPLLTDIATNQTWQEIRYRRNRGILHDGNYPHLSTPVKSLPDNGVKRCILGFNCFTDDVGDCCERAPEHSRAFNRTIRLYQALASTSTEANGDGTCIPAAATTSKDKIRFTPKEVMKNPALARLLVAAAKVKKAKASGS